MKFLLLPAASAILIAAFAALPGIMPAIMRCSARSGCVIGHHPATEHAKEEKVDQQQPAPDTAPQGGSDTGR